jgi:hypothetical protein
MAGLKTQDQCQSPSNQAPLEEPVAASDPAQPNVARIYDYLLGGRFL